FLRSLLLITKDRRSPLTEKREPSVSRFSRGNAARFRIKRYGEPKVPAAMIRRLQVIVNRGGGGHLPVVGSIVAGSCRTNSTLYPASSRGATAFTSHNVSTLAG